METFREILRLRMRHTFYGDAPMPVAVLPADQIAFQRADLMMRRHGADWLVITNAETLPDAVSFDLTTDTPQVLQVTRGANWHACPVIEAPIGVDEITLGANAATVARPRTTDQMTLAQVRVSLSPTPRIVTLHLKAQASHWAYHVLGPSSDAAFVEDPEGVIQFDAIAPRILPDGRTSHVLRSRQALPARARPSQRFALKTPGPFGPKTLIPVLPAPGPDFVSITVPESSRTLVQSDIYVTIL